MLPHLPIKFDFDWQSSFKEDFLNIMVYTFCPGVGADQPLGSNFFLNLQSICPFPASVALQMTIFQFFPLNAWAIYVGLAIKQVKAITGS